MDKTSPQIIRRDGMIADAQYVGWLKELKQRYAQAQAKAAVKVNEGMLSFYWSLGKDILHMKAESKWGKGFFNQLSMDLRQGFGVDKGFSVTNLKYIKRWFEFYTKDNAIRQQAVDELEMPTDFAFVSWSQHIKIFTKCHDVNEAMFYIHKTIEGNWSRSVLEDNLASHLYERQGNAITNFSDKSLLPQRKLAEELLKDPYDFSFLKMKTGYDEHELEDALIHNITRFLLELGQGFAFVGRQMELQMSNGKSYFPDLVFYHVRLKCYVVIELKVVEFIPEFVGKLNFYVSAADELLKQEDDNPSIGLLICKSHDKTTVEWSFRGIDRPIGVASYQLQEVVDRTLLEMRESLHNVERNEIEDGTDISGK